MTNEDRDDPGFSSARTSKKKRSFWWPLIGGGVALSVVGFTLGVLIGVLFEEPNLLIGHLAGDSEEVVLKPTGSPEAAPIEAPTDSQPDAPPVAPIEASEEKMVVKNVAPPVTVKSSEKTEVALDVSGAAQSAMLPPVSAAVPDGAASHAGKFVIQVGAFSNDAQAAAMAKQLHGSGYDAFVAPGTGGDARWRVRVGPFASREAAEKAAAKLKQQEKLPTWILTEEGK